MINLNTKRELGNGFLSLVTNTKQENMILPSSNEAKLIYQHVNNELIPLNNEYSRLIKRTRIS